MTTLPKHLLSIALGILFLSPVLMAKDKVVYDEWYLNQFKGKPVGYSHQKMVIETTDTSQRYRLDVEEVNLKLGTPYRRNTTWYTTDSGNLLSLSQTKQKGGTTEILKMNRTGSELLLEYTDPSGMQSTRISFSAKDFIGFSVLHPAIVQSLPPTVGAQREVPCFSQVTRKIEKQAIKVVKVNSEALEVEVTRTEIPKIVFLVEVGRDGKVKSLRSSDNQFSSTRTTKQHLIHVSY